MIYFNGVPSINCCFVVAHLVLHSGRHSALDLLSTFGFVHSYMHSLRQVWYLGSAFVPLIEGSVSFAAKAGFGEAVAANTAAAAEVQVVVRNERRFTDLLLLVLVLVLVDNAEAELMIQITARTARSMVLKVIVR